MSKIHYLKTWPEFFAAVKDGTKTFELREDDREFEVGDTLVLQEFRYSSQTYTGEEIVREVSYKLEGGCFGLHPKMCILSLKEVTQ